MLEDKCVCECVCAIAGPDSALDRSPQKGIEKANMPIKSSRAGVVAAAQKQAVVVPKKLASCVDREWRMHITYSCTTLIKKKRLVWGEVGLELLMKQHKKMTALRRPMPLNAKRSVMEITVLVEITEGYRQTARGTVSFMCQGYVQALVKH